MHIVLKTVSSCSCARRNARLAAPVLAASSVEQRNAALLSIKQQLDKKKSDIFAGNARDKRKAEGKVAPEVHKVCTLLRKPRGGSLRFCRGWTLKAQNSTHCCVEWTKFTRLAIL